MSVLQSLIASQKELCWTFDRRFVREHFRVDGNVHFIDEIVPRHLRPHSVVYDIGGGKQPLISLSTKTQLRLTIVGLDIDAGELARAPSGSYDRAICADIQHYQGQGDADLVICQALLEHVESQPAALQGVFSMLKPGGVALVFVPCRNSLYARLNLMLSQELKRKILFYLSPRAKHEQGFPAYYDCCTPRQFRSLVRQYNGSVVQEQYYYRSSYFFFSFPTYALWRVWVAASHIILGEQACESFSIVFRRNTRGGTETDGTQTEANS